MATTAERVTLAEATAIAEGLAGALRPACERLEVAGSIRRQRETIGDIELVAIPRQVTVPVGMFDSAEVSALDQAIDGLVADGVLVRLSGGERYVKLRHVASGIQVDLFTVRPPAQWGLIYLIRTGSAEFSQRFVTDLHLVGYHAAGGAVHQGGGYTDRAGWHPPMGCPAACQVAETPEEENVFTLARQGFILPEHRR